MWHTPCCLAVSDRIKAFDEQTLAWLHSIDIVPLLLGIVLAIKQFEAITFRNFRVFVGAWFWAEERREGAPDLHLAPIASRT
jgi:hypothetical protein